ncbi:hypothetical protein KKB44_05860 [Candidatus Micrarchaeota archaeon]|nr:hypothetical protein [Candidatus Micrarchaeota archaeon]
MILVVDTNIIIAAIIKPSTTQELILKEDIKFYSPEFLRNEIEKYRTEILKKSGYTESELESIISIMYSNITIVPKDEYQHLKEEVLKFTPHQSDWPFLALAKHLGATLWTNDSDLKIKQAVVHIITTAELVQMLEK